MKNKKLNMIFSTLLLSCLGVYVGAKVAYVSASSTGSVNVTVPSNISVVFNEDGTNTIGNYVVENNSLVPITVNTVEVSPNNGWSIVQQGSEILKDTKNLALSLFDKWLSSGNNELSVTIEEGGSKDVSPSIERGAWTSPIKESAFNLNFEYSIGQKDFKITFDTNGGDSINPITAKNGEKIILPSTSRTGYTLTGWRDSNGIVHQIGDEFIMPISGDKLTAQWRNNKYTIKFDGNGADSGSMDDLSCTYGVGDKLTKNDFSKNGYTFSHWNTKKEIDGKTYWLYQNTLDRSTSWFTEDEVPNGYVRHSYSDGTRTTSPTSIDGDVITLVAQWKANTYSIKFDNNDGSGTMSEQIVTYDTPSNLNLNEFLKTGYKFAGWNTSPFGTKNSYTDGQLISNLSSVDGDVVNLYAQWEPNIYTNTINPNNGDSSYTVSGVRGEFIDLEVPSKEGYTFNGWKCDTSDYVFSSKVLEGYNFSNNDLNGLRIYTVANPSVSSSYGSLEVVTASDDNPVGSPYEVKINSNSAYVWNSKNTYAGFMSYKKRCEDNSTYLHTFVAKVPKGVKLETITNSLGTGGSLEWYSTNYGTGEWETYSYKVVTGTGSSEDALGYIYVSSIEDSTISEPFSWRLAESTIVKISSGSDYTDLVMGSANHTFTAQWIPNSYEIKFNENYIVGNLYNNFYDISYWSNHNYANTISLKDDSTLSSGKYIESTVTSVADKLGGFYFNSSKDYELTVGKTYTWRAKVKASKNIDACYIGVENGGRFYHPITTEWQTITHTFTVDSSIYNSFTIYFTSGTLSIGDKICISELEIMEGSPSITSSSKDYNSQLGTLSTPSREGYTFLGWYDKAVGGNKISSTTKVPLNGATYYAQWTSNTYTINFNNNDGNGTMTSQTMSYDVASNLNTNKFSKSAHTFAGWNTSPFGTGTSYSNGESVKNLVAEDGGSITLYAQWSPNDISFTFDPKNGESVNVFKGVLGDMYDLETPSKEGYTFSGWLKSDYYGIFGKYNRVTDFSDGTLGNVQGYRYSSLDYSDYGKIELVNASTDNPTDNNYEVKITATSSYFASGLSKNTYMGFCTGSSTLSSTSYVHTFVAKIPKGIKVNPAFNNLGTGSSVTWYTSMYGTDEWETYSYIVNLGTNASSNALGFIYVYSIDDSVISLPFSWSLASSKIMQVTNVSTDPVKLIGSNDNTFTAQWTPIDYKITYNLDGGTNSSSNPSTYNIESDTITLNAPSKTGYTFTGWTESIIPNKWYDGFVDLNNGNIVNNSTSVWSNAVYTDFIKVDKGKTYTIDGFEGTVYNSLRIRAYDGSYNYLGCVGEEGIYPNTGFTPSNTYTPSEDGYIRIMLREDTYKDNVKMNISEISKSINITKGSTGDRVYTAQWSLNSYYLDVDSIIDDVHSTHTSDYVTFDVYINDQLVSNQVGDFYRQYPYGTKYEIKNIKAKDGYICNGIYTKDLSSIGRTPSEPLSGTIGAYYHKIYLDITTNNSSTNKLVDEDSTINDSSVDESLSNNSSVGESLVNSNEEYIEDDLNEVIKDNESGEDESITIEEVITPSEELITPVEDEIINSEDVETEESFMEDSSQNISEPSLGTNPIRETDVYYIEVE